MADAAGPRVVRLAGEADAGGFRAAARALIQEGVEPSRVSWLVAGAAEGDLFGSNADANPNPNPNPNPVAVVDAVAGGERPGASLPPLRLPAAFIAVCDRAVLHSDPGRFGLMYRLAWRLVHEPGLRHDPLDPDRLRAEHLARAVRRDMHKMTAFVRFRPLAAPTDDGWGVSHVAWFEPMCHIVEATAPFFARRFAQMPWAILTPERSARWNGRELAFGPGASRADAPPADADERLWLTYYESIFNPARLKLAMMQKEMPRRYWKNLPEATLIEPLTVQAMRRSGRMIEQGPSEPARRRAAASIAHRVDARAAALGSASTAPDTLAALRQATERCRDCPIGHCATQAVHGEGPPRARLMLIGEQPGDQEDLRGRPFVGPAGQLLDRALARLGWPRESLYLTNAVKHFKFELRGKRRIHKTPAQQEAAACLRWLEAEIALVQPEAVIALGATAARAVMGRAVAVMSERGRWLTREDGLRVLVTLHPAALLRMDRARDADAEFETWVTDLSRAATGAPAMQGPPDRPATQHAREMPARP